jgi:hypothetical protein
LILGKILCEPAQQKIVCVIEQKNICQCRPIRKTRHDPALQRPGSKNQDPKTNIQKPISKNQYPKTKGQGH